MHRHLYAATVALGLLGAATAAAQCVEPRNGWVRLRFTEPVPTEKPITGYRVRYGRVPGMFASTRDFPASATEFCVDGLDNVGSWYFDAAALSADGQSGWSNVACFTMTGTACLAGPFVTDVTALEFRDASTAQSRATLTLTWGVFSEFTLRIENTGQVPLQTVGLTLTDQVFDWLRNVTFEPNLGANNDDIESRSVTITTPVAPGALIDVRGDIDTRNPVGISATLTFAGAAPTTRPLAPTPTGFTVSF